MKQNEWVRCKECDQMSQWSFECTRVWRKQVNPAPIEGSRQYCLIVYVARSAKWKWRCSRMNGATATDDARYGNGHVNRIECGIFTYLVCIYEYRSVLYCIRKRVDANKIETSAKFFPWLGTNKHDGVTPRSVNSVDKWEVSANRFA